MSSVLITFQGKVGIKNGLSCPVSTNFQLLLYRINMGAACPVPRVLKILPTFVHAARAQVGLRIALAET